MGRGVSSLRQLARTTSCLCMTMMVVCAHDVKSAETRYAHATETQGTPSSDPQDVSRQDGVDLAKTIQQTEQHIHDIEHQLVDLQQKMEGQRGALDLNTERTARFLSQLWHVSHQSQADTLSDPANLNAHVRSTILAQRMIPYLHERSRILQHELGTLTQILKDANGRLVALKTYLATLLDQQQQLSRWVEASRPKAVVMSPIAAELRRTLSVSRPKSLSELIRHIESCTRKLPHLKTRTVDLQQPARGRVLATLARNQEHHAHGQALVIKTRSKAQIIAPTAGVVVFAGFLRGYDEVIVIAPSRNDVVILAGMAKVTAELGQELISGEPIGTMPTMIEDRPQLYVEVRKGTKVLDASAWVDPWNGALHDS